MARTATEGCYPMKGHKVRMGDDTKEALQIICKSTGYSMDEMWRMMIQSMVQAGAVDESTRKTLNGIWNQPDLKYTQREFIPPDTFYLPITQNMEELKEILQLLNSRIKELSAETLAGSELLTEIEYTS